MIPNGITNLDKGMNEWCILHAYRGSIAHNMYVPSKDPNSIDDKDTMAICVPPLDYYFGLESYGSRGTKEVKEGEWDIVIYEIKKFIGLLEKGNPNVLGLLWTDPRHIIYESEEGKYLRENREIFVGKHVFHQFSGYAKAQFYKMEHCAFKGYMGEKRKSLVEKHGYDTKNAAHLIRLMRMAIEFLNEGTLHVERPDNSELLAIKRGEWSIEKVKKEAEKLFDRAEVAYDKCSFPTKPNRKEVNQILRNICEMRI